MCLPEHATGGGHLCNPVFATGGGDTKNFFEMLVFFGVLHHSCQNAKKYPLFEKKFRVPPLQTQGYTKVPPPVACPGRHYTNGALLGVNTFAVPYPDNVIQVAKRVHLALKLSLVGLSLESTSFLLKQ